MTRIFIIVFGLAISLHQPLFAEDTHHGDAHTEMHEMEGHHDQHMHHHRAHDPEIDKQVTPLKGQSIYNLKSKWLDQDGKEVPIFVLRGKPVALAMVYTSCTSACPIITANLQQIESGLSEKARDNVQFALFSFDSDRDTPEKLKQFASLHHLDLKRWRLFHGDPKAVRELAAVLGIKYKKEADGNFDHSNVINILDSEGVLEKQVIGLNQDPHEAIEELNELAGKTGPMNGTPAKKGKE